MQRGRALLSLAALLAGLAAPQARADANLEYAVKAAYLTKFAPFINWPDGAFPASNAPLTLCVMGDNPFQGQLAQLVQNVHIGDHPMAMRRVSVPEAGCQMLFLAHMEAAAAQSAMDTVKGKPVLTVTDSQLGVHGVISFVIVDNHVRFDIDDAAAAQDGLAVSSKLLDLAHAVHPRGQP